MISYLTIGAKPNSGEYILDNYACLLNTPQPII